MRSAPTEALQGGACYDLLPQVYDKYFLGQNAFTRATARAICATCPIRDACLEDAIVEPPGHGIRAGQSNAVLWELHSRWLDDHIESDVLAAEAIAKQAASLKASQRSTHYRSGSIPSPQYAFPDLTGDA